MKKLLKRLILVFLIPFMIIIAIASMIISVFTWIAFGKEIMNNVCDNMILTSENFLNKN
jgi:hypothetical protein